MWGLVMVPSGSRISARSLRERFAPFGPLTREGNSGRNYVRFDDIWVLLVPTKLEENL
ncbi:hypothetical protein LEP1GSC097_0247 [Leptospira interrogans serovar Grippotyphosa str. UI 08368]|nr:hypothetical protein LEP1GSC097_0247 [Leptospira interrogans serovar Grippotyphosa str. UI 08368]